MYQGVTLGQGSDGGVPIIGDDVRIYPNAIVCGGIIIGDGTTVGALSYVARDTPSGCVVVGAPAKVIKKRGLLNG